MADLPRCECVPCVFSNWCAAPSRSVGTCAAAREHVIEIEFVGAANTVTGSKHLVHTPHASVLLDCGLFQGRRGESIEKNQHLGVDARELDAVVLSHAHIDHSGALPVLVKQGFTGSIHATA